MVLWRKHDGANAAALLQKGRGAGAQDLVPGLLGEVDHIREGELHAREGGLPGNVAQAVQGLVHSLQVCGCELLSELHVFKDSVFQILAPVRVGVESGAPGNVGKA